MSRWSSAWKEHADELLADGEWHDGLSWMLDVEKQIMPGPAQRRNERDRIRMSRNHQRRRLEAQFGRPLTPDELEAIEIPERIRGLDSPIAQVLAGKRIMVQALVHSRHRYGGYEVDPWPLPAGAWKSGGFKIRRPSRYSIAELGKRYRMKPEQVYDLALQDPPIPIVPRGPVRVIDREHLPALEMRVETYRDEARERRGAASRRRWEKHRSAEPTHIALTVLARRSGIGPDAARALKETHPELPWQPRGKRGILLPLKQEYLDVWDKIVEAYKADGPRRRHEASIQAAATKRMNRQ